MKGVKKILIVEDDAFAVKAYKIKFEQEGWEVVTAVNGREGLAYLAQKPVDLVILDLMLPGVNGFEVLQAIRKNENWKKTPVIILSNLGQESDIEQGKKLGADDYIIKANAKINDIASKVKSYLKEK